MINQEMSARLTDNENIILNCSPGIIAKINNEYKKILQMLSISIEYFINIYIHYINI